MYLLLTQNLSSTLVLLGCSEFVATFYVWRKHCEMSFYGRLASNFLLWKPKCPNSPFSIPWQLGLRNINQAQSIRYASLKVEHQRTKEWEQPGIHAGEAGVFCVQQCQLILWLWFLMPKLNWFQTICCTWFSSLLGYSVSHLISFH